MRKDNSKVCGYCGDDVYNDEEFCCEDCWEGYAWETFRKD